MITQLCSLQSSLNVISSPESTERKTLSAMDAGSILLSEQTKLIKNIGTYKYIVCLPSHLNNR